MTGYVNEPLYNRINYLTPAKYIKSGKIVEYDISKANITMLYQKGIIDDNMYNFLYILPKDDREKYVGNMIASNEDGSVYNAIRNGKLEAKKLLFESNNLTDNSIIRIADDAVYVAGSKDLEYTKFGLVEFKHKHVYTSFIHLKGDVCAFFYNGINTNDIEIVGISDNIVPLHEYYMLSFIGTIMYMMENSKKEVVLDYFNDIYTQYLRRELPIGFYREFNSDSLFRIGGYCVSSSFGIKVDYLDIGYNAELLRDLYGIICNVYMRFR